jgi:hypothetical protein
MGTLVFNKNFDIKDLEYVPAPEVVPAPGEVNITPPRPRKGHFVMVPLEWMERLESAHQIATSKVALHLLHQSFKDRRPVVRLANGVLALKGISRVQKRRALGEMEALGLISVERRPRKSPIVTLLYVAKGA